MADKIHVAIRVRPLINREEVDKAAICWKADTETIVQVDEDGKNKGQVYKFDRVFDMNETTQDVYEEIAQPIVKAAMEGYDGTIFAYGQTSSGKTFTMHGNKLQKGIIPLTIDEIFSAIEEVPEREFLLRAYYVELYNEMLKDLLSNEEKELKIRERSVKVGFTDKVRVTLERQTEIVCTKAEDFLALIRQGDERRHVGRTNMNEHSSRSHSIFCIIIESRLKKQKRDSAQGSVNFSHLYLVDLAGSEKANDTKASGERLKEACSINTSLFTLSNVIQGLSRGDGFVPFRNSKLTRLLQTSLGGNSKTAIICNVTPATIEQTHGTLQFASRAKTIENTATVNEILSEEAMLEKYKKEVKKMQKKIEEYEKGGLQNHLLKTETERDELAGRLEQTESEKNKLMQSESEKNKMIEEYKEKLRFLNSKVLSSTLLTTDGAPPKKRKTRRETWCPGSRGASFQATQALTNANLDWDIPRPTKRRASPPPATYSQSQSSEEGFKSPPVTMNRESAPESVPVFDDEEFNFKLPVNPPSSSSSEDDGCSWKKKRRRTVRFADEAPAVPCIQGDDLQSQLQETVGICENLQRQLEEKDNAYRQAQYELDVLRDEMDQKGVGDHEQGRLLEEQQTIIDNLEHDVRRYKTELRELQDYTKLESNTIQETEDKLNGEIVTLKQKLEEAQQMQQMNFEERSLADAQFMVMDQRKQLSELTDKKRHLEQQMESVNKDMKKLKEEKSDFDSHLHFEKERHNKMVTDLKEQLQRAYDENATLSSSGSTDAKSTSETNQDALLIELEQLKETVEELNDKKLQLELDLGDSIDASIEAQEQLLQAQDENAALQGQLADINSTRNDDELFTLHETIENLKQQLEEVKGQGELQDEKLNTATPATQELELEKEGLHGEVTKLNHQLNENKRVVEELTGKNDELSRQIQATSSGRQSIDDDREWLQMQVATLETQLKDANMYQSIADDLKTRAVDLEMQLAEREEQLQQEIQKVEMVNEDMKKLSEEKSYQNASLSTVGSSDTNATEAQSTTEISQETGVMAIEIEQLKKTVEELTSKYTDLETELGDSIEASIEAQEQLLQAQEENSTLQERLAKGGEVSNAALQEMELAREALQGQITELNQERETLQGQVTELNQQLNENRRVVVEFTEKNGELARQIQTTNVDNEKFNSELEEKEHRILALEKQIEKLNEALNTEGESDAEQLQMEVDRLQQELQESESSNQKTLEVLTLTKQGLEEYENQQEHNSKEANNKVEMFRKMALDMEAENESLQSQVEVFKQQLSENGRTVEELVEKNSQLSRQIQASKRQSVDDIDWLQMQVTALETQLKEANKYQSIADDHKNRVIDLEVQLAEKEEQLQQEQEVQKSDSTRNDDELFALHETIENLKQELEEVKCQGELQNEKVNSATQELELEKEVLHEEVTKLNQQLNDNKRVVEELTEKNDELSRNIQATSTGQQSDDDVRECLQNENKELRHKVEIITREVEREKGVLEDKISTLNQQLNENRNVVEEFEEKNGELSRQIQATHMELEEKQNKIQELETQTENLNERTHLESGEIEQLQIEVERLTQELQESETANQKTLEVLTLTKQGLEEFEDQQEALRGEITRLNQELSESRKMIEEKNEQLDEITRLNQELSESRNAIEVENGKLSRQIQATHTDKDTFIGQLEEKESKIHDLESQIDHMNKRFDLGVIEYKKLEMEVETLKQNLQESETEHEKTLEVLTLTEQEFQELETKNEQDCEELRRQVEMLTTARQEEEQEKEALQCEVRTLNQQLSENRKVVEEITEKNGELSRQIQAATSQRHSVDDDREWLRMQVATLETQLEAGTSQRQSFNDERERLHMQVATLETQLEAATSQRHSVDDNREWLRMQVATLETQLKDANMYQSIADDLKTRVADLEVQLAEKEEQLQQGVQKSADVKKMKDKHKEEIRKLVAEMEEQETFLKTCCEKSDDELNEAVLKKVEYLEKIANLKADLKKMQDEHKDEKRKLVAEKDKQEIFLKNCCEKSDDELNEAVHKKMEYLNKIKELKTQIDTLQAKPAVVPEETEALNTQIKKLDLHVNFLEYELRRTKDKLEEANFHVENDAMKFRKHIKKLMAENEKLKEEKGNSSSTKADAPAAPVNPVSSASSGVILECELLSVQRKNKALAKDKDRLEKDNKEKVMQIMTLEEERIKLRREMNHYSKLAKEYYAKYKSMKQPGTGEADPTLDSHQQRALQGVNEMPGAERSPARRRPGPPPPSHTEQLPGTSKTTEQLPSTSKTSEQLPSTSKNEWPTFEKSRFDEWPTFEKGEDEIEDNADKCKQQ